MKALCTCFSANSTTQHYNREASAHPYYTAVKAGAPYRSKHTPVACPMWRSQLAFWLSRFLRQHQHWLLLLEQLWQLCGVPASLRPATVCELAGVWTLHNTCVCCSCHVGGASSLFHSVIAAILRSCYGFLQCVPLICCQHIASERPCKLHCKTHYMARQLRQLCNHQLRQRHALRTAVSSQTKNTQALTRM